jgi:hypothetical protein
MNFEWYEEVSPPAVLEQGDIIENCNVILPGQSHYKAIIENQATDDPLKIVAITGIVMSQSCDITNDKIDSIIVCPIWPLKKLIEADPYYRSKGAREELRQGKAPAFHLLNKLRTDQLPEDFYFVDFHNIYSVPKAFLQELTTGAKRKRLLPPYREHLSQSFARYFMRVGLPTDIPVDEIKNYQC